MANPLPAQEAIAHQRIGLFGGSFDPPHLGHLALVEAGLRCGLDAVWVIPAQPVHRQLSGAATDAQRWAWLKQLFGHHPQVQLLDWELRQEKPTPAIVTLRRCHTDYPTTTFWFMLGQDAWQQISSWIDYPAHAELCNMAIFRRSDCSDDCVIDEHWQSSAPAALSELRGHGYCCQIDVALPAISATQVRRAAAAGESLAEFVGADLCHAIRACYSKQATQQPI